MKIICPDFGFTVETDRLFLIQTLVSDFVLQYLAVNNLISLCLVFFSIKVFTKNSSLR